MLRAKQSVPYCHEPLHYEFVLGELAAPGEDSSIFNAYNYLNRLRVGYSPTSKNRQLNIGRVPPKVFFLSCGLLGGMESTPRQQLHISHRARVKQNALEML